MSSPIHPSDQQVAIPETLQRQLDEFRRKLWRAKVMEALAAGMAGLLVSFLLVYVLDRIWQTPGWARLVILAAGVSLFAIFLPLWLRRWVWGHRRENDLARLVARRYPGLGDRLLGVIELQNQQGNADSLSPRLREAAMQSVAVEVGRRSLDEALPPQRQRMLALVAGGLGAAALAAFLIAPRAGWNALERWLLPFSKTERYTFTRLENPPRSLTVPFGEAFTLSLKLSKDTEQKPDRASGRYGLQTEVTAARRADAYDFTFPGQQEPGTITFRVGDVRHVVRVEPVQRPGIAQVSALVRPPAYLRIREKVVDLKSGVLSAVEGSRVKISLNTTRPLVSGVYGKSEPMTVAGLTAETPLLEVGREPFEVPFAWTDEFGLTGDAGFRLRVDAMVDAAPSVYLQGIDRQKAMLPEETVDFEVLSEDDFGVMQVGIEWSGQFTRPTDEAPAKGEMKVADGGPEARRLAQGAAFSPAAFGIQPQKITLRAYTEDFFPKRARVYSEPVVIYVLSRDEHAQLLKSQFDRNIAELEDLARREVEQLDENQRLDALKPQDLQSEEARKRLAAQEQAEAENTRRMQELKERMETLLKDATRNGEIDKETLKKMAESLKSMQELADRDMPEVQEKLGDSQYPANESAQAKKDLSDAVEEQKKVVEKMQDSIAKANDANRNMEAGTFVNRLKKAASEQEGIAGSLVEAFSRILGSSTAGLDPKDQRRLTDASKQQSNTAADVRWLQEDLGHYFARTGKEEFRGILTEMRDSKIDLGLEDVRTRLGVNHSFLATEGAKEWAAKLTAWAAKLDGELKKNDPAGGGGDGPPSAEDEDFEFMLRVMKMIQQEQDLRARTRALEQLRRSVTSKEGES